MSEVITCPCCGRRLRLPDLRPGAELRCGACGAVFPLPARDVREPDPAVRPEGSPARDPQGLQHAPDQHPRAMAPPAWEEDASPPRGDRTALVWAGLAVAAMTALLVVAINWKPGGRRQGGPDTVWEDPEERRRELQAAFGPQKPLAEGDIAREVRPLLDDLGEAFRARDGQRLAARAGTWSACATSWTRWECPSRG